MPSPLPGEQNNQTDQRFPAKKLIWGILVVVILLAVGAGALALKGKFLVSTAPPNLDSEGLPSFTGTANVPFEQQHINITPHSYSNK